MSEVSMYRKATCRCTKSIWRKASSSFTVVFRRNLDRQLHQIPQGLVNVVRRLRLVCSMENPSANDIDKAPS